MGILDSLLPERKPDHNGILGLMGDDTAIRMQLAGQILSNLAWGGKPMDTASALSNASMNSMQRKKMKREMDLQQKMVDAANNYADKVEKTNPDLAAALRANPQLGEEIWKGKIARENDPAYLFQQQILGKSGGSSFTPGSLPADGGGGPSAIPLSTGSPPTSLTPPDTVQSPTATLQTPGADTSTPVPELKKRIMEITGIKDLTDQESQALALGATGGSNTFNSVLNQIRDERRVAKEDALNQENRSADNKRADEAAARAEANRIADNARADENARLAQANREADNARADEAAKLAKIASDRSNTVAERQAAASEANILNQEKTRTLEQNKFIQGEADKLYDDFAQKVKPIEPILDMGIRFKGMTDQQLTQNPAMAREVLVSFSKALDPTTGVLAGEARDAATGASYPDMLQGMIEKFDAGGGLPPELVVQMRGVIDQLSTKALQKYKNIKVDTAIRAKKRGIPPEFIFTESQNMPTPPPGATGTDTANPFDSLGAK